MYVIDAVGFNAEVYRLKLDDFALLLCKDIYIRADSPMPYWELLGIDNTLDTWYEVENVDLATQMTEQCCNGMC